MKDGTRVSGTSRKYKLTPSYKEGNGYYKHEYVAEVIRRQMARKLQRKVS